MKKLLLILFALFGIYGYSQKTLEIYNFTPYTVVIVDMSTNASGTYPEFRPNLSIVNFIPLAPGANYTLTNTASLTRFPFESPTSVPYIPNWIRMTSATASTGLTSPVAWVLGNPQVFNWVAFRVLDPPGGSAGTVGVANPLITSTNWVAIYDQFTSGTVTTYTVVIN
jgi:hypothetical protein